jgi:hypothetical protein
VRRATVCMNVRIMDITSVDWTRQISTGSTNNPNLKTDSWLPSNQESAFLSVLLVPPVLIWLCPIHTCNIHSENVGDLNLCVRNNGKYGLLIVWLYSNATGI